MRDWLVGLVARLPVGVHVKLLLAAFLAIAVLLIAEGAVGLGAVMAVTASA